MRLVDADALQRAFDDAHKDEPDFFCSNFLNDAGNPSTEWDCVDDILENAPTIDAQPVTRGKWVKYPSIYRCSNCGNPKACIISAMVGMVIGAIIGHYVPELDLPDVSKAIIALFGYAISGFAGFIISVIEGVISDFKDGDA